MTLYIPLNTVFPDPATPAYEAMAVGTANATTSLTVNVPTGTENNDWLILAVTKVTAAALGGLTGWTEKVSSAEPPLYVYERQASSEPASYTITWTGNDDAVGIMTRASQTAGVTFTGTDIFRALAQTGNGLAISSPGFSALAALSASRVAFIDSTNDSLRAYDFNGTDWSLTGNGLSVASVSQPAIAALSSSRVAFADDGGQLCSYDFDGTDWSKIGNSLSISGPLFVSLAALSSSRVAFIDAVNDTLQAYDFDGTDWTPLGNGLSISNASASALAALSSTRIALIDNTNDQLRAYDFDGTDWSQVGNGLSISGNNNPALAALSSSVVIWADDNDVLRGYAFDGADWEQIVELAVSGINLPSLAALSASEVAFIDSGNDQLRFYTLTGNSTPTAPALTTGSVNNLVMRFMSAGGASITTDDGEPAGTTVVAVRASPNSLVSLGAAYEVVAAVEDVGAAAFALTAPQPWAAASVLLRAGDENPEAPLVQTLIDRTLGTAIGNMTLGGGLAALFDGNTDQTDTQGGYNGGVIVYVGKDWGVGNTHTVNGFKCWGSNNKGFSNVASPNITITLQGSTDNFSASIVDLGSEGPVVDANSLEISKLTGITTTTAYRYHRLKIAASHSAGDNIFGAECQFFEDA